MLDKLFDRLPIGIAIFDREYHIERFNETWKKFSLRYSPPLAAPLTPGVDYFEHLPGSESIAIPLFKRVLAGETIREHAREFVSGGITSYWDVLLTPLVEDGEVRGILNVTNDVTEHVLLRQNLENRVNERTRELRSLLDVSAAANSSLDLDETLIATLDLLIKLINASRVGVMLLNEKSGKLEARLLRPEQEIPVDDLAQIMRACENVIARDEMLYIAPDIEKGFLEPGALLPLHIRGKRLGVLVIIGSQGKQFNQEQLLLFNSIGEQLGVALENAQLYKQAQELAVMEERNRLARDLHDAVTQTLFSASMIADVLPKIWDRNPDEGWLRLEELRQLTRGALSEMRTLLVELRPAALIETDLEDLIGHQINAFNARTRIPVEFYCTCSQNPPTDVKEMLYRVV